MKILIFDADHKTQDAFMKSFEGHHLIFSDAPVSEEMLRTNPDAEAVSVFVTSSLREPHMDLLPNLACIATRSTGYDHIATEYAKKRGIVVCNVPRYGTHTVAEFTFALILALSRKVPAAVKQVREGGDMSTLPFEGFNLFGKTIGVIGTGAIGKNVVKIAQGFGMEVLMHDPFPAKDIENEHARYAALEELLQNSDIITLHVPYTKDNRHLLNRERFALMKNDAYLINTARGELVDTAALCEALDAGHVAGAGLDVLEAERELKNEPRALTNASPDVLQTLIRDRELIENPRVLVTPHIAFFSKEAYDEILNISIHNIQNFIAGKTGNTV